MNPRAKMNEAESEATGTRDKQMQQHLLQDTQHAESQT